METRRQVVLHLAFLTIGVIIRVAKGFAPESSFATSRTRPPHPLLPVPLDGSFTSNDGGKESDGGNASSFARQKNVRNNTDKRRRGERTLYDILNASPTDTSRQLRRKYTDAARRTHPDAAIGSSGRQIEGTNQGAEDDFRDVAAAWSILSDPKKRLQYDRSLKAKEFTNSMESLIDTGFNVAFPFLFETAPHRLNRTASDLGKTMQHVGERLDKARTAAQLNRKSNEMKQRATRNINRVKELQARLHSPNRRIEALQQTADKEEFTSKQASKIIQRFEFLDDKGDVVSQTIDALAQVEDEYNERTRVRQSVQKDLSLMEENVDFATLDKERANKRLEETRQKLVNAETQRRQLEGDRDETMRVQQQMRKDLTLAKQTIDSAQRDEQLAKEHLEEARRLFEEAEAQRKQVEGQYEQTLREQQRIQKEMGLMEQKIDPVRLNEQKVKEQLEETHQKVEETCSALTNYVQDLSLAEQQMDRSASNLDNSSAALKQQRDATRRALRQVEDLNISKENAYLKEEHKRLEDIAAILLAKAEEFRIQASELSKE